MRANTPESFGLGIIINEECRIIFRNIVNFRIYRSGGSIWGEHFHFIIVMVFEQQGMYFLIFLVRIICPIQVELVKLQNEATTRYPASKSPKKDGSGTSQI